MATVHHTGQPSPVRRGTVGMMIVMSPTVSGQYDPWVAGPLGQGDPKGANFLPPRRSFIKETREGNVTVMSRLAVAL